MRREKRNLSSQNPGANDSFVSFYLPWIAGLVAFNNIQKKTVFAPERTESGHANAVDEKNPDNSQCILLQSIPADDEGH